MGSRQSGDAVGDAGTRSDRGDPQTAGQAAVSLGCMSGRLLMTDIYHPYPLLNAAVENGNNVPTGEREDRVHAFGF